MGDRNATVGPPELEVLEGGGEQSIPLERRRTRGTAGVDVLLERRRRAAARARRRRPSDGTRTIRGA